MASSCSELKRGASLALLMLSSACGYESIELYPNQAEAGAPGASVERVPTSSQCEAKVPAGMRAAVPPMGWNGWPSFGCAASFNESKLRQMADALVDSGMQAAGYEYLNLDDCWDLGRNAAGELVLDSVRLPSGMPTLSNDIHQKGLKIGVFRDAADCFDAPETAAVVNSRQAEDIATYASWKADYVKHRACIAPTRTRADFERMAAAWRDSGSSLVLGVAAPPFADWMRDVGQTVRSSETTTPTWDSLLGALDAATELAAYARPGFFNDPDVLHVGNSKLTEAEARAHFSLWSILSAPLVASNDLTTMTASTREILTNRALIQLNQDALGLQAAVVRQNGALSIYAKPLSACGARGVVLFNRGGTALTTTLDWREIWLDAGQASVRDLWTGADLEPASEALEISVPAHDVRALEVVGHEPLNFHDDVWLADAPFTYAENRLGPIERNSSNGEGAAGDGQPIRIAGQEFSRGLGMHAPALVRFRLGGLCSRFTASVGVDDEEDGLGSVTFEVWADGEKLFDSGVVTGGTPARVVDLSVAGRNDLRLLVGRAGDGSVSDHGDWGDARLFCAPL